ncbi:UNVERIFIED_ORG: hypothetical protein M2438_005240 [Methylobacterium sp. SuP10 SLI 274]|nr:hypothetical protein [Methylobacterium sp. SuP10 SLI 274]
MRASGTRGRAIRRLSTRGGLPHRHVDAALDQVEDVVAGQDLDRDAGMAGEEARQARRDLALREGRGRGHAHDAAGPVAGDVLRRPNGLQGGPAPHEEFSALLGQAELARSPLEQTDTEPPLEALEALGDEGEGDVEVKRGPGQAARPHDGVEHAEVVDAVQPAHSRIRARAERTARRRPGQLLHSHLISEEIACA